MVADELRAHLKEGGFILETSSIGHSGIKKERWSHPTDNLTEVKLYEYLPDQDQTEEREVEHISVKKSEPEWNPFDPTPEELGL